MADLIRRIIRSLSVRQKFCRDVPDGARVLDVGCGTGTNGVILKRLHPSVELYGIDIISQADNAGLYRYTQVDLDQGMLPFPDEYFDALLFTHVLEHLHTPWPLGREINRVMRHGGRIYVEAPNWTSALVPSFGFHREQHDPFNFYDDPTHVKPWTRQGLFEFLDQGCRLSVDKVGSTRSWLRIPLDIAVLSWGLVRGNRARIVFSFWDLSGWCVYGIGTKR